MGEQRCLNKGMTVSGWGARNSYSDEHAVSVSARALCGHDPDRWQAHSSPATLAVRNLLFYHSPLKGESPDSGRESVDQLLQAQRAAEKQRVGRAERGLNLLR